MKKKICFVVQRYGLEVNGGAELEARELAEHLLPLYPDIHVLTTKAIDYLSWRNEYEPDIDVINGVTVHRFPVEKERIRTEFDEINGRFLAGSMDESEEKDWIIKQGPYAPRLIQYIEEHYDDYDAFVFFTYLYYPTAIGVSKARGKSITVPTAHDEPFLKMKIFDDVFLSPNAILFNTDEERRLVQRKYHNERIPCAIGAGGVDLPEDIDPDRFKAKYGQDDFIIYVGRIDEGKNCKQLFDYFDKYKRRYHRDIKLILLGKPVIPIPEREDIVSLGFVSEQDKFDGISAAKAMIMPSEFESLSFIVLESMMVGTPILVNGRCTVLKGHCMKSNGGLYYTNYLEFEGLLNYILDHPDEMKGLCKNAKEYAERHYSWDAIAKNASALIESI